MTDCYIGNCSTCNNGNPHSNTTPDTDGLIYISRYNNFHNKPSGYFHDSLDFDEYEDDNTTR